MAQRVSYALALATGIGGVLMLALGFLPDPGLGPSASGLRSLDASLADAGAVYARNALTVALLASGGAAVALTVASRGRRPAGRMLAYLLLLAAMLWLYFVSGVDALAADEGVSRASLMARLLHGYLELPALLLPWAAIVVALREPRDPSGANQRIDWRLVGAATAFAAALLAPAALLEAYVVASAVRAA